MSIYSDPERHAANPPETWTVHKADARRWEVRDAEGNMLATARTKTLALVERDPAIPGTIAAAYVKEGRWYAGESIPTWRPWADVLAERERNAARRAARAAAAVS